MKCYECDGLALIQTNELFSGTLDDWEDQVYEEDMLVNMHYSIPTDMYKSLLTVTPCPYCDGTGKE